MSSRKYKLTSIAPRPASTVGSKYSHNDTLMIGGSAVRLQQQNETLDSIDGQQQQMSTSIQIPLDALSENGISLDSDNIVFVLPDGFDESQLHNLDLAVSKPSTSSYVPIAPAPYPRPDEPHEADVNAIYRFVDNLSPTGLEDVNMSAIQQLSSHHLDHSPTPVSGSGMRPSNVMLPVSMAQHTHDSSQGLLASNMSLVTDDDSRKCDTPSIMSGLMHTPFDGEQTVDYDLDSGEGEYKCSFCTMVFERRFNFVQHLRTHTRQRPYQCMLCGRAFSQNSNVKRHILTHKVFPHLIGVDQARHKNHFGLAKSISSGGKVNATMLVCCYCGKNYTSKSLLSIHLNKEHQLEKRFVCRIPDCLYVCEFAPDLLEHERAMHGDSQFAYQCPHCQLYFYSLQDVGTHQHTDHAFQKNDKSSSASADREKSSEPPPIEGNKRVIDQTQPCSLCNKIFKSQSALQKHLLTDAHHHDCKICNKAFVTRRQLRNHVACHKQAEEGQGHYCDYCQEQFAYRSTKWRHMRQMHPDEQVTDTSTSQRTAVGCSSCNLTFSRRDALLRHIRTCHGTARKYSCQYDGCGKRFSRSDMLNEHVNTVHKLDNPHLTFMCDLCDIPFKRYRSLFVHNMSRHAPPASLLRVSCDHCQQVFTRKSSLKVHIQRQHLPSQP